MATLELNDAHETVMRRISNYPMAITKACAAIGELAEFADMPGNYFSVLMQLIKKISVIKPTQPIFARRSTLARESHKSVETVGRMLRWMEDRGYITREQKANPGLRGSTSHIRPTTKLINLLGLKVKPKRLPSFSDGSISALPNPYSLFKKQPEKNFIHNQDATTPPPKFVTVHGKRIPIELAWLVQKNKLLVTGLLRLMKLAKQAGHRLSDVVAVSVNCLIPLKSRDLYGYLISLLQKDKDYGYLAKKQNDDATKENETRQRKVLLARKMQEWNGRLFTNQSQSVTYLVRGCSLEIQGGGNASKPMDIEFVDAVMDGKLRLIQ